jgi:hypothetical protein
MSGGHSPSIFIGGLVTILVLYDIPVENKTKYNMSVWSEMPGQIYL